MIHGVNSDSTPASAYAKSFGPVVVVVVNIPLVGRLIIRTREERDAKGRRYFEVRGGDGRIRHWILRVMRMFTNRVRSHRVVVTLISEGLGLSTEY